MNNSHPKTKSARELSVKEVFGIAILLLLGLVGYYVFMFGLGPIDENLWGDWSGGYVNSWGIRYKHNMPLTPNKFVTLMALAGNVCWILVFFVTQAAGGNNPISRLLLIMAGLLLLPLLLYLLVYFFLAGALISLVYLLYWLIRSAIRYIVRGKVS